MMISFVGHAFVANRREVKEKVKKQLRRVLSRSERITCYLGGRGDFDELCAEACRDLKREFGGIETVYVTPDIRLGAQLRIKDMERMGLYDASVYPPIEKTPPRFAIIKRNEWMMESADLIIAYVSHEYGGAFRALRFAKRRKKEIVNLFEEL